MSHDDEMDAAMARIGVLRYRLEHAEIDKAHLKAELTDLKSTADRFKTEVDSLMTNPTSRLLRTEREDNARLKAEVKRLTKHDDDTCRHYIMRLLLESQNTFLNDRVERLTKAGDNLVYVVSEHPVSEPFVKAWFAAKGVQS